jgi:PAS domain S-box-containing protein
VVGGRTVRLLGTFQDITERKEAEKARQDSEERFRVLTEESPLGISLLDAKGRYIYVNPAFVNMFGYSLDEIGTGSDWFTLAYPDPDYRQQVREIWLEDLQNMPPGISRPRTFEVSCKNGDRRIILFRPVTISEGRQFIIYEDITETTQDGGAAPKARDPTRSSPEDGRPRARSPAESPTTLITSSPPYLGTLNWPWTTLPKDNATDSVKTWPK